MVGGSLWVIANHSRLSGVSLGFVMRAQGMGKARNPGWNGGEYPWQKLGYLEFVAAACALEAGAWLAGSVAVDDEMIEEDRAECRRNARELMAASKAFAEEAGFWARERGLKEEVFCG